MTYRLRVDAIRDARAALWPVPGPVTPLGPDKPLPLAEQVAVTADVMGDDYVIVFDRGGNLKAIRPLELTHRRGT